MKVDEMTQDEWINKCREANNLKVTFRNYCPIREGCLVRLHRKHTQYNNGERIRISDPDFKYENELAVVMEAKTNVDFMAGIPCHFRPWHIDFQVHILKNGDSYAWFEADELELVEDPFEQYRTYLIREVEDDKKRSIGSIKPGTWNN